MQLYQHIFEYERVAYGPRLIENAVQQQGEIRAALSHGDSRAAREAMAAHIRASRNYALEAFDRRSSRPSLTPLEALALPDDLSRHIEALGPYKPQMSQGQESPLFSTLLWPDRYA